MPRTFLSLIALSALLVPTFATAQEPPKAKGAVGEGVPAFTVRPGYSVSLAATDLKESRFMAFDEAGTLYVSQPKAGTILALKDTDSNGSYEFVAPFVTDKPTVQAMQFKDGWLWFATSQGVYKTRDKDNDGVSDETVVVIPEGQLPGKTGHWWRSLLVTDDGFYTSVGDPGNATDEESERMKIWHFDLNGSNKKLFVTGIRNTEELQIRPGTKEIWGWDHNSDNFAATYGETKDKTPITDLNPPEEFNHYVEGNFYGHPYVNATRIPRPEFAKKEGIIDIAAKTTVPEWTYSAHWAINGWTFLTKDAFPGHKGDVITAAHGSWNSSKKVGYRVDRVLFDLWTSKPYGSHMLVSTLAADGKEVLARPCDVVEAPDGSLLFTDDSKGKIYRISHEKIEGNVGH